MSSQYIFTMYKLSRIHPPDKRVLEDISLSFLPGAKIGVLGPNGSGKSTLLRIMAGQDTDFRGDAQLAHAVLDVAADVLGWVELRLLFEQPDGGAGGELGVAAEVGILSSHDAQERRLARAVRPEHADLGARQERQRDVLEHPLVRRVDPGKLVHGEDVLAGHERSRIESGRGTGGLCRGLLP